MNPHLKYAAALLAIALIALTAGRLTSPGAAGMSGPVAGVHTQAQNPGSAGTNQTASNGTPGATQAPTTASQLYELIAEHPASILRVTFLNGSSQVSVECKGQKPIVITLPDGDNAKLTEELNAAHVAFGAQDPDPFRSFLSHWWPVLLIGAIFLGVSFFARQYQMRKAMADPSGGALGKGKRAGESRAKRVDKKKSNIEKVTFADVAGCDEAVTELKRLTKSWVRPWIMQLFAVKKARGVLLVGPPGTGKTLLARAVANEVDGTFDFISGSDFTEMFVGVGASRVRDMFDKGVATVAKTKKPYIIFIDEIDAVGGKRGGFNHNDEREATLNALLVELDGMASNRNIIIIGATNRPDMLDDALLRPGRLGIQIQVDLPDVVGREAIWGIHLRQRMALLSGVSLRALAESSFMFSGAEIAASADKGAEIAAERYDSRITALLEAGFVLEDAKKQVKAEITMHDLEEAKDFVKFGDAMRSKQANMGDDQKLQTAYHEGAHAVVSRIFEPDADPVVKATIMRRGGALGFILRMPKTDAVSLTREQALAKIVTCMAGRIAQEKFLNTCDTGASNDFEQGTKVARKMVAGWGMTKLGHISFGESSSPMRGMGGGGTDAPFGPKLANRMDNEYLRIVNGCSAAARLAVELEADRIEALAKRLMKDETILGAQLEELYEKIPSKAKPEDLKVPYWKGAPNV